VPSDRAALHAAIASRFDACSRPGWSTSSRGLRGAYALEPAMPSMRSVGLSPGVATFSTATIDASELRARGIAATRQLAKRQLTWLRSTPADTFVPASRPSSDAVAGRVRVLPMQ
jgi:tRNA dimethylallyltransferase